MAEFDCYLYRLNMIYIERNSFPFFQHNSIQCMESSDNDIKSKVFYSSITNKGETYKKGDAVFLEPGSYTYNIKAPPAPKPKATVKQVLFMFIFMDITLFCIIVISE